MEGADAAHVVAFARRRGDEAVVCVVPRLVLTLHDRGNGKLALDARVQLPDGLQRTWIDVVTGRPHDPAATLPVASLFADFPVALLSAS